MQTALYEIHKDLGAKLVEFHGWEMPIHYQGIIHEHQVVRQQVGLFDVSHMGRIFIEGEDALALLDFLSTNDLSDKQDGTATYTVWCAENGTCVDDLIVYQENPKKFFVIVNAGNREKDLLHLQHYAKDFQVVITDRFREDGILALQGPHAEKVLSQLFPEVVQLKHMQFLNVFDEGLTITIARTGYTGSDGFEIYAAHSAIVKLWKALLEKGKAYGIEPIGLGARNTLRLEMGYALYGHELSDTIAVTESVSAWTVKWHKSNFLGKAALQSLKQSQHCRHEYGITLIGKGIAREGYPVFQNGKEIGYVTSGTQSPTLNQAIAIILVEAKLQKGDLVEVQIRQDLCPAKVVALPFVRL